MFKRIRKPTQRIQRTFERIDKMRNERLNYPFVMFVALMPYMTADTIKALALLPPPSYIGGREVPSNLQMVTFGKLVALQNAPTDNDYLKTCCALVSELVGLNPDRVASLPARHVLGVVNMIKSEMERIGKLFQSLQGDNTSDERMAGIDRLNFGTFGVVDWYAKRMGIVNHDEVFDTPWQRVYQCMKIDHEQGEFEKRYRKVIERKRK